MKVHYHLRQEGRQSPTYHGVVQVHLMGSGLIVLVFHRFLYILLLDVVATFGQSNRLVSDIVYALNGWTGLLFFSTCVFLLCIESTFSKWESMYVIDCRHPLTTWQLGEKKIIPTEL